MAAVDGELPSAAAPPSADAIPPRPRRRVAPGPRADPDRDARTRGVRLARPVHLARPHGRRADPRTDTARRRAVGRRDGPARPGTPARGVARHHPPTARLAVGQSAIIRAML